MTSVPVASVTRPHGVTPAPAIGSAPGWPLVLYFHHVHPEIDHYTSLTPESFVRGLDVLLRHFTPADPHLLRAPETRCTTSESPTMLLTFDDGYRDLLDHAVRPMQERGIKAVFFVCTSLVGLRSADPRADYLDWDECAALRDAGHLVASHGKTHTPLNRLTTDEAAEEVTGSLGRLRDQLGLDAALYAFPYGIEAPVPQEVPGLGPLLSFGSVKAPARAWSPAHSVRRTYLPTGTDDTWDELARGWRAGWDAS